MNISLELLQKGDVLLSSRKKNIFNFLVSAVTHSKWGHTFLYIGDNQIIESTGKGVQIADISKYQSTHYDAIGCFRINQITEAQIDKMIDSAKQQIGTRYGFFQIVYMGLVYISKQANHRFWQREVDSGQTCTELILRAAEEAGIKLFDDNPSMVAPGDFEKNNKLTKIF